MQSIRSFCNYFSSNASQLIAPLHFKKIAVIAMGIGLGACAYKTYFQNSYPEEKTPYTKPLFVRPIDRSEYQEVSSFVSDWRKQTSSEAKKIYQNLSRELTAPYPPRAFGAFDESGHLQGLVTFGEVRNQYLLVSHIATAPWNLGAFGIYRGVGSSLLGRIVKLASENPNLKSPHPIQLEYIPSSKSFYEARHFEIFGSSAYFPRKNLVPFLNQFGNRALFQ